MALAAWPSSPPLANLARVAAARQQGSADQEAEELVRQADELAKAPQEGHEEAKGEAVQQMLAELQRKLDELVGKGKVRPAPRSARRSASWPRRRSSQAEAGCQSSTSQ